ncbi:uncharacterized protein DUF2158 [Azorhizobium sp. AG788]|uniref:YodC family protein n=1 Tax=Azorhizobium sp. AG788 TaxID=2183897 RepID=UPI00105C0844|nr:DUF2158 domain-containing protein [Azorhizobium sp. AG788]TDU01168.1 uncharacterized protein DUF2158 [Azorhizobium sp. AG788]
MAFAPGDIVQLKSGSPALTVISESGEMVEVVWYSDENGEFRTQTLPVIGLEVLDITEFEVEEDGDEEDED